MTLTKSLKTLPWLASRCFGLRCFAFFAAACLVASAATQTVTTVAGGFIGDGNPATSASLASPVGIARDTHGNIYVSDTYNCRIRVINSAGVINTYAGTGIAATAVTAAPPSPPKF